MLGAIVLMILVVVLGAAFLIVGGLWALTRQAGAQLPGLKPLRVACYTFCTTVCCTFCTTPPEAFAMKLEIKKIGNSTGLILPKELLARTWIWIRASGCLRH